MKIILIIIMACLLSGCASTRIKHLNHDQFIKKSAQIGKINSAQRTIFLSNTLTRFYLEYQNYIENSTTIYWIEASKLSRKEIEAIVYTFRAR